MYYVYFLMLNNASIYKGLTIRLKQRYYEHIYGKVESTRHKRPLRMIGYEAYVLKSDAQRREKYLKTTEGRRLLRSQYKDIINKTKP